MEHKKKSRKKSVIQALTAVLLMGALGFLISYGVRIYTNMQDKNEYRDQGIAAYNEGNYSEAISNFQTSLSKEVQFAQPVDRDTRLYLADSYFLTEQYAEAIEQYDILLETEEEQIEYLNLQKKMSQGFIEMKEGNYDAALPAFQAAIEAGHTECALYAGMCATKLGRTDEQVAYLTTYVDYEPESSYACAQLADYYFQQGRYSTCHQYLEQGLHSSDKSCIEQLRYIEILYYESQHDYDKAYELICEYRMNYTVTDLVQKEYDFLYTRQNLES